MKNHAAKIGLSILVLAVGLAALERPSAAHDQTTGASPYIKSQIAFPDDAFASYSRAGSVAWIKFTIFPEPNDPDLYFQDSKKYMFHYTFAVKHLGPFVGMTTQQFNEATLFKDNQQAVLGTVIFPPVSGSPARADFPEYGIQFVRQDPYDREQVRDMFNLVKAHVTAPADVQAFYFPTYEQEAAAQADREWFESQGIKLGSTARWIQGNISYSQGWALGRLKFFAAKDVVIAYHSSSLEPTDILLTDGIPAELPYLAGILSQTPSTPNSHVAILSRAYGVPFAYAALAADAARAQKLVGHRVIYTVYEDQYGTCDLKLIDTEGFLDEATIAQVLGLKKVSPLHVSPMEPYGAIGIPTSELTPEAVRYVGGKASNFGILHAALPDNSPKSIALTFDLWNAFLDQPLRPAPELVLEPGKYMLFWADDDEEQGPTHTSFALSRSGESVALIDRDGATAIDVVQFGSQKEDVSWGRSVDGGGTWNAFKKPTPGQPNASEEPVKGKGLVINEVMADNGETLEDPCEAGDFPDWIELYNASDSPITLNGMYLTDDVNRPTKWQIPVATKGKTLREEILLRLSPFTSYPPADLQKLAMDLAVIRNLFTSAGATPFVPELRDAVIDAVSNPEYGFEPNVPLRFRSSTNVEDSEDFVGAGLYDSFGGCLADDLDADDNGPCACDPNRETEDSILETIRQVFASFYNDNAYLERLRHEVNEADVGMAVLVHHSFPDEIELANGVATLDRKDSAESTIVTLVTQTGSVSVTNPTDASIPEEVVAEVLSSGFVKLTPASLKRQSSLIPVGRTVMDWPNDYRNLVGLLMRVSNQFSQTTGKTNYTLDLEYKKVAPGGGVLPAGGLVVKQVRQVPSPAQVTPFLIDVPLELEVFPGEFEIMEATDVFADHRLKSRWTLETQSMVLDANNLNARLYGKVRMEYVDGDQVRTIEQQMPLLPFAAHAFDGQAATDTWQLPDLANPRTYGLNTTQIPTAVSPDQSPIVTLADLGANARNIMNIDLPYKCLMLKVEYNLPVPSWRQQPAQSTLPSSLGTTTNDRVYLWPRLSPEPDDILQQRSFASGGVSVRTSFYFPPPPAGFASWELATAPLKRWDRTVIEGLTAEPIVLQGYYSQTYRPEHHNQIENFLFEPRLEPGISPEILSQLKDKNIRLIHLIYDNTGGTLSKIATYGFD